MNPNENPTTVCPYSSRRFIVNQNAGNLQDCPECGARIDLTEVEE